jgi:hypothetical protein
VTRRQRVLVVLHLVVPVLLVLAIAVATNWAAISVARW